MSERKNRDVYLDKMLINWIKGTARRERWRFAGWYDISDLIQEGYVCYCKCRDRYTLSAPSKPGFQDLNTDTPSSEQRRHFMALVQTAFHNHLTTLAVKCPALQEAPVDCSVMDDSMVVLEGLLPPQPEEASVLAALVTAPSEIGEAIGKLMSDGLEGEAFLRSRLRKRGDRVVRGRRALRETTTAYFQRLLGDGELPKKASAYLYS